MPSTSGAPARPLQVTWEMTRECMWKVSPTRLARLKRDKREFSTAEAFHLVEEVAALQVPLFVLTGGDPLLRPDLFPIVEFASRHSLRVSMTLPPTPLLCAATIADLKACGLMRAAFWLHGSTPALHDGFTGISGSHKRTLEMIGACHEEQLPVQINTMITRRNFHDVDALIELLTRLDVILWNVFFLVPSDRDHTEELLNPAEHEQVFSRLYEGSQRVQFQIKTSEGQHYQRFLLEQRMRELHGRTRKSEVMMRATRGVNDSRGVVFVDHIGDVYPGRYLPLPAGNVTREPLADVFQKSELFASLRDSSRLKGKCGRCPVRTVCGGSRARAYAMTGDLFAEEPCCAYEP
ncbi:MAG TPA: radical SAM protein [Candidatus Sulfotelmatobacter sp.]|nr:radical SAM protein [Candidatus Sulfotelmatobacter sp.]